MDVARAAKLCLAVGLAALIGAVAAPEAMARRKPPPVIVPPPPPPPLPNVGMATSLVQEAAAFDSYVRQAAAISPAFTDAANVSSSLKIGAAYEPGELRRGAVAYAAINVLTDAAFVADVRKAGATPEGRYAVEARIFAHPVSALDFADGSRAAGIAKQVLAEDGMKLFDNGNAVKQAAYTIQHQPWSLADVLDRDGRASAVKALSRSQRPVSADETAALERVIESGGPAPAAEPAPPPYSPVVVHAVALAALAAIGEAGDNDVSRLGWLTDDYFMDHCLAQAKLALFECLAVARPNYEDVFCLGQHAIKDTGACVTQGAGSVVPIEIGVEPLSIPRARVRHAVRHRRRRK